MMHPRSSLALANGNADQAESGQHHGETGGFGDGGDGTGRTDLDRAVRRDERADDAQLRNRSVVQPAALSKV
jgi:hypothetical protein